MRSAATPARLFGALLTYWVLGGLFAVMTYEMSDLGLSNDFVAVVVSGLLLMPAAVLLALKTARFQRLRPVVLAIAALSAAGMITLLFWWPAAAPAIACVCLPAGTFAAVWLGPEADRRRST